MPPEAAEDAAQVLRWSNADKGRYRVAPLQHERAIGASFMTYRAAVFDDDRTIGRKSTMHLDLPETACADTIALLRARLTDALDLAARMKQAYWTVTDSSSCERRELFEACHDEIDECIDSLARRIAALSGVAECRIRAKALERSRHRYPLRSSRGEQLETAIRMVLARFSRAVRADINQAAELGDAATVDVLGGVSRKVDTQLWVTQARLL